MDRSQSSRRVYLPSMDLAYGGIWPGRGFAILTPPLTDDYNFSLSQSKLSRGLVDEPAENFCVFSHFHHSILDPFVANCLMM